ncbi:GNAT family N-acetyltransferase [Rapidithrix thailandica]|uniref:GNAT family N-acetyltransferase n=1 Tax=Rapidithrix thailandica TaxID=413964 RepID=A0AAW9SKV4_9BACT
MDRIICNQSDIRTAAEEINYTILINSCCREFANSTFYYGSPKYDEVLGKYFDETGHQLHLKIDFPEGIEVYVPLKYASESGRHQYYFPVVERNLSTDELRVIDMDRFLELVTSQALTAHPDATVENSKERLHNSVDNIEKYLTHFYENKLKVNKAEMNFIEAEQLLAIGHHAHPLTKGRSGFSGKELFTYSPETGGRFKLHYFLIHPTCVTERNVEEQCFSEIFREDLLKHADTNVLGLLNENPEWKVVPAHPWEAQYLLQEPLVQEMIANEALYDLGAWGALYTPTSSVRTVYNEESDWMFKFSLHVKITSAERVNYLHELHRGHDFARLLATELGQKLKNQFDYINFITDPGFISVAYKGRVINGFNTSIRKNPFKGEFANKNVSLLASIFQDEVLGEKSRMANIIEEAAKRKKQPVQEVALAWFEAYIELVVPATVTIFSEFGIACELHQQNVLVEFDDDLFPAKIHIRDNQSFLYRKSREKALTALVPDLATQGNAFIRDERLLDLISHYFLVSNLAALVNVMGATGLVKEQTLVELWYKKVVDLKDEDETGLVDYLLNNRYWKVKGNLITALLNVDGGEAPASVVMVNYPNLLHLRFFSRQLIFPQPDEVIYSRYFPKEEVTIRIRPIDLERDLEMLHEWFHRDHAKKIWKMDWPIRELEVYYRTMLAGNALSSYIGEANGVPTCNFEVYWATRDLVGDYYDVLPSDYGTHQFIAPTDPKKKYVSPFTQCMVDYVFAQPEVGKMVGEGAVDSLASMMNKAHVGFKIEKVIEMPHKKANLNFCYREWYWAKFPQNKNIVISPVAEKSTELVSHE